MAISPIFLGGVLPFRLLCNPSSSSFQDTGIAFSAQTGNSSQVYIIPAANTSDQGSSQNSTWSTFTQMASQMLSSATVGFVLLSGLAGLASLFNNRGAGVAKEGSTRSLEPSSQNTSLIPA